MKPAFSTVACPTWTFEKLAEQGGAWGFLGVELRTFGSGSTRLACDPALTGGEKLRRLMRRTGFEFASLATGVRFDEPITPPVMGRVFSDTERSVREAKSAIDLAASLGCPYVRVFGFEYGSERRASALARIVERLKKAVDHCSNRGVELVLENGGSFPTGVDLAEVLDAVDHPRLLAGYSIPVAMAAGENPASGINVLGERLAVVKVKDVKEGRPCALGDGEIDCRPGVEALAKCGFDGWVVFEYDRLWFKDVPEPDDVLARSARTLFSWIGRGVSALPRRAGIPRAPGRETAYA